MEKHIVIVFIGGKSKRMEELISVPIDCSSEDEATIKYLIEEIRDIDAISKIVEFQFSLDEQNRNSQFEDMIQDNINQLKKKINDYHKISVDFITCPNNCRKDQSDECQKCISVKLAEIVTQKTISQDYCPN